MLDGSTAADEAVPYFPFTIDHANLLKDAKEILTVLFPHWDVNDDVVFRKETEGITKWVSSFLSTVN